jgi:hypothetical protein
MDNGQELRPSDDILWQLDQLSWPPELEGSLAKLGRAHDPAYGGATYQLVKEDDTVILQDDDGGTSGGGGGGGATLVIGDPDSTLKEEHVVNEESKVKPLVENSIEQSESHQHIGEQPSRNEAEEEEEEEELREVEVEHVSESSSLSSSSSSGERIDNAVYFFDLTFHGALPLFLGRAIGLILLANVLVILKLLRPMSPHRRYFGYLMNLIHSTLVGARAMIVSWRHRPKRWKQQDMQSTEASSLKVV